MSEIKQSRRDHILEKANNLIYSKGYNQTSFAEIAAEVGITKGNLHYHFNSKEDLLENIIALRNVEIKKNLAFWSEQFSEPKDKLKRFVQMLLNEETALIRYGCPMGSLNMELGKDQQSLQEKSRVMFDLFLAWLEKIFKQIDKKNSKSLSQHLLVMAQGSALMAYIYSDTTKLINFILIIRDKNILDKIRYI